LTTLHLHLLSDSTGETLEVIATACLAQFEDVEVRRHLWPMVRSEGHLDRVLDDVERRPGLVLYTLVNNTLRRDLEQKCRRGHHAVSRSIRSVHACRPCWQGRRPPGSPAPLDAAYFARVDAIQFTDRRMTTASGRKLGGGRHRARGRLAHVADSTFDLLANRGFKVANIPLCRESPPPH
jgi:regulator of PEP synthase PpsR (kinase-PPPase family)